VVRDTAKAVGWAQQDCDVLQADINDVEALRQAFSGIEGVFVLLAPNFDPSPGFLKSRQLIAAVRKALEEARPTRVGRRVQRWAPMVRCITRRSVQVSIVEGYHLQIEGSSSLDENCLPHKPILAGQYHQDDAERAWLMS
jgi:hypothetical protein